jgi:hypothetical protein
MSQNNKQHECRKMVKFMSFTHSERNIWNGPMVARAISREKRKPVLEGNGFAKYSDNLYAPCMWYLLLRYWTVLWTQYLGVDERAIPKYSGLTL